MFLESVQIPAATTLSRSVQSRNDAELCLKERLKEVLRTILISVFFSNNGTKVQKRAGFLHKHFCFLNHPLVQKSKEKFILASIDRSTRSKSIYSTVALQGHGRFSKDTLMIRLNCVWMNWTRLPTPLWCFVTKRYVLLSIRLIFCQTKLSEVRKKW